MPVPASPELGSMCFSLCYFFFCFFLLCQCLSHSECAYYIHEPSVSGNQGQDLPATASTESLHSSYHRKSEVESSREEPMALSTGMVSKHTSWPIRNTY